MKTTNKEPEDWKPVTDYNSPDLEMDQIQLYLMQNRRTPQNEFEKKLLAEIREIEAKGQTVAFLHNGI